MAVFVDSLWVELYHGMKINDPYKESCRFHLYSLHYVFTLSESSAELLNHFVNLVNLTVIYISLNSYQNIFSRSYLLVILLRRGNPGLVATIQGLSTPNCVNDLD